MPVIKKDLWFGLIRKGTFTDNKGKEQVIDDNRLDKIISSTSAREYQNNEIPIVIGHPKSDSPKWGSVLKSDIKKLGEVIVGKPNKLVTEFQEWVQKGLYDNISIALRPDQSIKHIAFLGAQPPAITGLPAVEFSEEENSEIEFSEMQQYQLSGWYFSDLVTLLRGLKNYFIEKEGLDAANNMMPEAIMTELADAPQIWPVYDSNNSFSENIVKDTIIMTPEEIAEMQKKNNDLAAENLALTNKAKAEALKVKHDGFIAFCEAPEMRKKISPKIQPVVIAFMEKFEDSEEICFSEEGTEKKVSAIDEFKNLLKQLPDVVEFSEVATKDKVNDKETNTSKEVTTGLRIAEIVNKK